MEITKEKAVDYSLIFVIVILIIVVLLSFKSNENYRRIDMPKIPTAEELLNYLGLTNSGSSENFEFSLTTIGKYVEENPNSSISKLLNQYGINPIITPYQQSEHFINPPDFINPTGIINNIIDVFTNLGKKIGF